MTAWRAAAVASTPDILTLATSLNTLIRLAGRSDMRGCGLEVWVPGAAEPDVTVTGVTDLVSTRVDGGWLVTGCVDGQYSVSTNRPS